MKRECISSTIVLVFLLVFNACCEGAQGGQQQIIGKIYCVDGSGSYNTELYRLPFSDLSQDDKKLVNMAIFNIERGEMASILSLHKKGSSGPCAQLLINLSSTEKNNLINRSSNCQGLYLSLDSGEGIPIHIIKENVETVSGQGDKSTERQPNIKLKTGPEGTGISSINIVIPIFVACCAAFLIFLMFRKR